jgi:TolB-like protein/DNA-binding winged helix-turn-helix (wHTH) protein/Tfp pilus assembly protein PilF
MTPNNDTVGLFNGFALDRTRGCLINSGEPVHLRPQTYRVLEYLVDNSGRLISKDTLIENVWEGRAVTDGAVGKCIEELRSVFGEEGWQYLQNVRGRGYIFDRNRQPDANTLRETHSEEIDMVRVIVEQSNGDSDASGSRKNLKSRWRDTTALLAVACVLVFVLIAGYWFYETRRSAKVISSIAVLPLKNESGNSDVDYLSDGMTDSLINRLSRLPGLTIKARSTVFRYKGKDVDARSIASELSVQAVLSGRFVQHGDNVTLYVSLVDGQTGNQLWGDQYERKLDQLPSLERETAEEIAGQLNSKLGPADQRRLANGSTNNSEAYRAYLKGNYYWNNPARGNYVKSLEFFQRAIDIDPTYAIGYAGVAHYYGFAAATGQMPPDENWQRSEAAVKKALELDETKAENHNALSGIQLYYHRDWSAAERSFKRGIELNPASAEVRRHYAKCLILFGRNDEALDQIQRAVELEPLAVSYNLDAARIYFWLRQYPQAIKQLKEVLELEPRSLATHDLLGSVYEKIGDQKAAIAEWAKLLSLVGQDNIAFLLQRTFERSGFDAALRVRGEQTLQSLADRSKQGEYVAPAEYVTAYTMMGDKDNAFVWLEKATQEHTRFAFEFKINPLYDRLRSDPRFQQLADRVKAD